MSIDSTHLRNMTMLTTVEAYELVRDAFYEDQAYTISRICVIWNFTRRIMDMHPQIREQIETSFRTFLSDHYPEIYVVYLLLA